MSTVDCAVKPVPTIVVFPPAGAIVEADVIVGLVAPTGIVPDAPRAIVTPLTVIELFVKALLPSPRPELFVSVPVTVAAPGIVVVVLFSPTVRAAPDRDWETTL